MKWYVKILWLPFCHLLEFFGFCTGVKCWVACLLVTTDLKGSENWKESPTSCRFSNEELRPVLIDAMPMEPLWISHDDCELTDLEDRKDLEIKPFTETVKLWFISLGYFTRRNIFSESCPYYFTSGTQGRAHSPFLTAPGLPDTQGQGRQKEAEGWAGYKCDCEGKGTDFKCVAFCFPLFFSF